MSRGEMRRRRGEGEYNVPRDVDTLGANEDGYFLCPVLRFNRKHCQK